MAYPEDLPIILYYRVGKTVRVTLPRSPVQNMSTSGVTNADEVCPQIPHGATAWQVANGPWRPMNELPRHWMPFLERERGTELDCRPKRNSQ